MKHLLGFIFSILTYKKLEEFFNTIAFALTFAFLFQTFLYQPFKIPSSSMKPGLQIGDYLFVEKFVYGYNNSSLSFMLNRFDIFSDAFFYNEPKRGDVIVFLLPRDSSIHYIKRLIGLPGDKIQMKEGQLYINNIAVKKEYQGQKIDIGKSGMLHIKDIYRETLLNGINYLIYVSHNEDKLKFPNDTPIYKIPQGHYFFMGDNRNNSVDSRFLKDVGFVAKNRILGKAKILFWTHDFSIHDFVTKLETNRTFKLIK